MPGLLPKKTINLECQYKFQNESVELRMPFGNCWGYIGFWNPTKLRTHSKLRVVNYEVVGRFLNMTISDASQMLAG